MKLRCYAQFQCHDRDLRYDVEAGDNIPPGQLFVVSRKAKRASA
jgi:hypothetical protein